jgi:hypothetical protein
MPKPFRLMTRSTQRMIVGSLIGQTAELELKNGLMFFCEPRGLASPALEIGKGFESLLVFSHYFSGDLYVVGLREISTLEPKERPITDPQHPDYEDPGRKVEPIKPWGTTAKLARERNKS